MNQRPPDWIIVGIPTEDGVIVLASTQLTQAELEYEAEQLESWAQPWSRPISERYTLTAEMRSFVMISGPDYPSAMATLFDQWSPEQQRAKRHSLERNTPSLGA